VTNRFRKRILLAGKDRGFLRIGSEFLPQADSYRIPGTRFAGVDASQIRELRARAANYDTVLFCLSDPNTMELAKSLEGVGAEVIVFSILTPVYLGQLPWVTSSLAVYGWGEESFRAGYSVLLGRADSRGTMPVNLGAGR